MKGEQDGWTERGERGTKGRQQNARRRWVDGGGERTASRASTTPRCNCPATALWPRTVNCKEADRRTMEETGGGEEEQTTGGQGDGWGEQPSGWSLRESDRKMEERRV